MRRQLTSLVLATITLLIQIQFTFGFQSSKNPCATARECLHPVPCFRTFSSTPNTILFLQKKESNNETEVATTPTLPSNDLLTNIEFGLVAADLLSLALASQMLGLLDILDNPTFWANGGWFQPVTVESSTSTLPKLVERFSTMSALYLVVAVGLGNLQSPRNNNNDDSSTILANSNDNLSILSRTVQSALAFAVLRGLLAVGVAVATKQDVAITDVLRETYFLALAIGASRYITYNIFYR